ncbi:hypothetical protein V1517DRAFT_337592 [Lipomyces orientalis]|uniref:Uncharacterized protein n=1 Tax=Lipomyces orientalis TaxID=1233043 RepID=A0ACC3TS60_9ASCO
MDDNCQIDLEYCSFCPKSFFGGFTAWKDLPDAIKLRMCEYLESVFPLLQVAYDNWASKVFFAKAFGRKDRNPARALSVKNCKSVLKDSDYIHRARHDDDASIYEDISARIGSDESVDLYAEESRPSLCPEASCESSSSDCSVAVSHNHECEDNYERASIEVRKSQFSQRQKRQSSKARTIVHNLEIERAKEADRQRRYDSAKRRRQYKEMAVKMNEEIDEQESIIRDMELGMPEINNAKTADGDENVVGHEDVGYHLGEIKEGDTATILSESKERVAMVEKTKYKKVKTQKRTTRRVLLRPAKPKTAASPGEERIKEAASSADDCSEQSSSSDSEMTTGHKAAACAGEQDNDDTNKAGQPARRVGGVSQNFKRLKMRSKSGKRFGKRHR